MNTSTSSLLRPRATLMGRLTRYWRDGGPWGWLNALAVSISLMLMVGLLSLLVFGSFSHFWPSRVVALQVPASALQASYPSSGVTSAQAASDTGKADAKASVATADDGNRQLLLGKLVHEEQREVQVASGAAPQRSWWLMQISSAQGEAAHWEWLPEDEIGELDFPEQALALELRDGRILYAQAQALSSPTTGEFERAPLIDGTAHPLSKDATPFFVRLREVERQRDHLTALRIATERLSDEMLNLALERASAIAQGEPIDELDEGINSARATLIKRENQLTLLRDALSGASVQLSGLGGYDGTIALVDIQRAWQPNSLGFGGRLVLTLTRFADFISGASNDGVRGAWPAIFGTVLMVVLMSIVVMPFGVMAALYLHEIAHQGRLTQLMRIALRNLAGVPSIVYGVFGLGFFVYGLGGSIDRLFYAERLPTPTFGTGGILWASLTLALLTLPVVIVATEEGLARVPRRLREGALALGATRFETLRRVVIPAASPALMTGLILAVARAAGEVAPLMLVGVVKLAPDLPLDDTFPWLHLDRKFMHLGHQIYDLAFQSSEAFSNRPLVYATALVLVVVILCLNLSAIRLRHLLAQRYKGATE